MWRMRTIRAPGAGTSEREGAEREVEELYRKELLFRFFRLACQYGYVTGNEKTTAGREHTEKLKEVLESYSGALYGKSYHR